ncbi:MAG: cytochrome-c peroxidase [Flammeovirgaceae bacterium]
MRTILLLLFVLVTLTACVDEKLAKTVQRSTQTVQMANYLSEPIRPLITPKQNADQVQLGEMLFHDVRLSGDCQTSCASCHSLEKGGGDALPVPVSQGKKLPFNALSVINASHNFRQYWNGKLATLEDQIDDVMQIDGNMHANLKEVVTYLNQLPEYISRFKQVYHNKATEAYFKDALVAYLTSLASPSRFDDFLLGKRDAITIDEKMGYLKFKEYGCTTCHQGINVGGNMFQKLGIVRNYFQDRGYISHVDYGRFNLTKNEADKFVFRVPSLRNIAITAPYLHDGSIGELSKVIKIMGTYQLGKDIPDEDIKQIEAFLKSLTGKRYDLHEVTAANTLINK